MTKKKEPAIALGPIITEIKLSIDRFQFAHEGGEDLVSPLLDLQANVEDLVDAVDKNDVCRK